MNIKKIIIGGIIGLTLMSQNGINAFADTISYQVRSGDTYWKISERYSIDLNELLSENSANSNSYLNVGQTIELPFNPYDKLLYKAVWGDTYWKVSEKFNVDINKLLEANHADSQTMINVDDILIIPVKNIYRTHIVEAGETYWKISQKYSVDINELLKINNANEYSELFVGQKILIPDGASSESEYSTQENDDEAYVTYTYYTVQKGDDFWKISIKFGIPQYELIKVNNMTENTILYIGDVIKIPVHNVPVKNTLGEKYGEYLDWWTEAQYVIPIGKVFKVRDFYTGKEWTMKRTVGANHADCEPLTKYDSAVMKEVWGGDYSWKTRPVIIIVDGRKIAASASAMPHDIQYIYDNGVTGHMDIHFANSTRHKDGKIDYDHQYNIKISAGLK
ncbi:LysM peptidoglycan-binding domain-containing protein [Paramaledivibacter caminithermalis]|uniref:LysM repeat-containing protein n=1 Tax=Paramaledivibacter caminithermalis (strain DSM 15212 / CIP 107654 / DViRD3) TaxID=1121301 RepID=A0A1M6KSW3_PARC5|nr:LysM peptidoglycan-binding domain-containing protein [Paramaledivibacter caminithermalis]SHJ62087.1 LysM repeat-containing protein [Paramaledivibacter caminithermalis DSM 15212]